MYLFSVFFYSFISLSSRISFIFFILVLLFYVDSFPPMSDDFSCLDSPGGGHGNLLQYFCLENPHGQRSLEGYSPWSHEGLNTTEWLHMDAYLWICSLLWLDGMGLLYNCVDLLPPRTSLWNGRTDCGFCLSGQGLSTGSLPFRLCGWRGRKAGTPTTDKEGLFSGGRAL